MRAHILITRSYNINNNAFIGRDLLPNCWAVTKFPTPPHNTVCQSKGKDDVFKIQIVGNTVQYLRNDELMYTSKKAPTFPLRIQCALEAKGTKFTDDTMF